MHPPWNFANLVSLKWHFLHFVVFYEVFILITDIFGLFFAVVNPSFQKQGDFFYCFYTMSTLKNRCKLNVHETSMHSVGSHTGMGSVILSTFVTDTLNLLYRLLALYNSAQHAVFSGETGWDITGKESAIRNVLHSDHKKILTCTISNFSPCFKSFMINWENLIKIGRARGNKSNWKDWNLWM